MSLGEACDLEPPPGVPLAVHAGVTNWNSGANLLQEAAARIAMVQAAVGEMEGVAIGAVLARLGEAAGQATRLSAVLEVAAVALMQYAGDLEDGRTKAKEAQTADEGAHEQYVRAEKRLEIVVQLSPGDFAQISSLKQQMREAVADETKAVTDWTTACDDVKESATATIGMLDAVADGPAALPLSGIGTSREGLIGGLRALGLANAISSGKLNPQERDERALEMGYLLRKYGADPAFQAALLGSEDSVRDYYSFLTTAAEADRDSALAAVGLEYAQTSRAQLGAWTSKLSPMQAYEVGQRLVAAADGGFGGAPGVYAAYLLSGDLGQGPASSALALGAADELDLHRREGDDVIQKSRGEALEFLEIAGPEAMSSGSLPHAVFTQLEKHPDAALDFFAPSNDRELSQDRLNYWLNPIGIPLGIAGMFDDGGVAVLGAVSAATNQGAYSNNDQQAIRAAHLAFDLTESITGNFGLLAVPESIDAMGRELLVKAYAPYIEGIGFALAPEGQKWKEGVKDDLLFEYQFAGGGDESYPFERVPAFDEGNIRAVIVATSGPGGREAWVDAVNGHMARIGEGMRTLVDSGSIMPVDRDLALRTPISTSGKNAAAVWGMVTSTQVANAEAADKLRDSMVVDGATLALAGLGPNGAIAGGTAGVTTNHVLNGLLPAWHQADDVLKEAQRSEIIRASALVVSYTKGTDPRVASVPVEMRLEAVNEALIEMGFATEKQSKNKTALESVAEDLTNEMAATRDGS